jgi:tetratricopeptide (TPR) repeat protein
MGLALPGQSLRRAAPTARPDTRSPTGVLGGEPADVVGPAQVAAMRHLAAAQALNLAEVQMARGLVQQAAGTLEQVRQLQPEHVVVLQRLGECRAFLGDADACWPLAQALLKASPTDPWGHILLGAWHILTSDHSGAAPHLARARALAPSQPRVALRLGGLHLLRGDPTEAESCFQAALAGEPDMAEALFGLGAALSAQRRPAAAEEALRASIRRQHLLPQAHLQLGVVLMAQERWLEAVGALETARVQQPDLPDADALLTEARAGLAQHVAATVIASRR